MTPNLPKELSDALHKSGNTLKVIDPVDNRTYFLVDNETHRKAMEALHQQDDWESIQRGAEQADNGEGMSLEEADKKIRSELKFLT